MKLLTIGVSFPTGLDRTRIIEYGKLFDELHVIVMIHPVNGSTSHGARPVPRAYRQAAEQHGNVWFWRAVHHTRLGRLLEARRLARRIVEERSIDLISSQDPAESGWVAYRAAKRCGLPLHVQIHTDIFSPWFRSHSFLNALRVRIARRVIPKAAGIRVVSHRIAESLVRELGTPRERIDVLPIFIDRESITTTPALDRAARYPEFDFLVVMVSRLAEEKDVPTALRAFAELKRTRAKAGLVILGEGPCRSMIEEKIKKLDLSYSVRLEGHIEAPVSYMKSADCYLLTSRFEGYGRSVIEAAAAGIPIVMTDVGVAGDIIRDNDTGFVAPVGDADVIAEKLKYVASHRDEAQKISERAKNEVTTLAPRTKEEYLSRYKESFRV